MQGLSRVYEETPVGGQPSRTTSIGFARIVAEQMDMRKERAGRIFLLVSLPRWLRALALDSQLGGRLELIWTENANRTAAAGQEVTKNLVTLYP